MEAAHRRADLTARLPPELFPLSGRKPPARSPRLTQGRKLRGDALSPALKRSGGCAYHGVASMPLTVGTKPTAVSKVSIAVL